jgi:enoyl-CoA hydratase
MSQVAQPGTIRVETDGSIALITLDNEARRNAYTPELLLQLSDALTAYDEDDSLRAAVLDAAGEHFSAGLDMPKFFGPGADFAGFPDGNVDPFGLGRRCRKPIVTVVHGITYTAAIELMLAGDIVVAADTARFRQMEAARGIAPLGGAHFRYLSRTGWGDAMLHLLMCDEFDAAEAYRIGLVQEVLPFGVHRERALEIAWTIAKNAPLGIRATKAAARLFIEAGEQAAIAAIPDIRAQVLNSEDAKEGIQSFVERREARFAGR